MPSEGRYTSYNNKFNSQGFASVHCLEEAETVSHVLWSCDFAVLVWSGFRFKVDQVVSFQEVVHCVLKI